MPTLFVQYTGPDAEGAAQAVQQAMKSPGNYASPIPARFSLGAKLRWFAAWTWGAGKSILHTLRQPCPLDQKFGELRMKFTALGT